MIISSGFKRLKEWTENLENIRARINTKPISIFLELEDSYRSHPITYIYQGKLLTLINILQMLLENMVLLEADVLPKEDIVVHTHLHIDKNQDLVIVLDFYREKETGHLFPLHLTSFFQKYSQRYSFYIDPIATSLEGSISLSSQPPYITLSLNAQYFLLQE